jgi:predicted transcriptional regulator of viral defense system
MTILGRKMIKTLIEVLVNWPKSYITGTDLKILIDKSYDACHSLVKRLSKEGTLVKIKNDLYLIKQSLRNELPDKFELAELIWGPSYISFESALSHHGWIPEAVYTTSSACTKKGKNVETSIGLFSYEHIPTDAFSVGLHHHAETSVSFLIADPWKAIGDTIYARRKKWPDIGALCEDLRIEWEVLQTSDTKLLMYLAQDYPSVRTRTILSQFYEELCR